MEAFVKWFVVGLFALGAIGRVMMINDEREPITRGDAAFNILFSGALISLIVIYL